LPACFCVQIEEIRRQFEAARLEAESAAATAALTAQNAAVLEQRLQEAKVNSFF
jgi:hypothetical protein